MVEPNNITSELNDYDTELDNIKYKLNVQHTKSLKISVRTKQPRSSYFNDSQINTDGKNKFYVSKNTRQKQPKTHIVKSKDFSTFYLTNDYSVWPEKKYNEKESYNKDDNPAPRKKDGENNKIR